MSLKKLGRYDLVRVLGKGAMGIVYEGRDPNLDRRVAIKTVKVENLSEEAASEYEGRFRTEARSAARLQHPNIVSVYDSDRDGDIAFLVMEYIQGEDLKHHLDKGERYSLEHSLKMIRDLLSALDYAHKQGIVHRDIKPANLLIEPGGRVKLTDFGVARIQDSGEATRTQGSMVGTLKYMSPEQVQGQKTDSRADLFSVGVVLYQLLTDKRPFDGDNDFSIIHQIIGHTPPPPSSFNARLPSAIDAVVARALAKDREQRFATARDFASALQSAIRRAEDATVIPPADPFKKKDAAGSGAQGQPSHAGGATVPTSGSTVTQEIELVYWKDVKDSADQEELKGFLAKFPAGIYADLARRRLRKLASGGGVPDQTILSGAAMPAGHPDSEATQLRSGTSASPAGSSTIPAGIEAASAPSPSSSAMPSAAVEPMADFAPTLIEPTVPEPQALSSATSASPANATMAQSADATSSPAVVGHTAPARPSAASSVTGRQPVRRQSLVAVLAAVGALAAVGVSAVMMMGQGGGETNAAAPLAGPLAAASAVVVASPIVPTAGPGAAPSAPPGGSGASGVPSALPSVVASKPASTAVARSATAAAARSARAAPARPAAQHVAVPAQSAKAAPAPVVESRLEAPEPPPRREEPRPVRAQSVAAAPNPAEMCADKVFLSREFCLAQQCVKPGGRNHPLCIKRREEAKLREESRIRN